jgi:hypothetical protein
MTFSSNWAGILATSSADQFEAASISGASAKWTVPRLGPPPAPLSIAVPTATDGRIVAADIVPPSSHCWMWVGIDSTPGKPPRRKSRAKPLLHEADNKDKDSEEPWADNQAQSHHGGPLLRGPRGVGIQIGTASEWIPDGAPNKQINGGGQVDWAWFGVPGSAPTILVGFSVAHGDEVSGSVSYVPPKTVGGGGKTDVAGQFRLTLRNHSRGIATVVPASLSIAPRSPRSTAAFMVEAPRDGAPTSRGGLGGIGSQSGIAPLADFGGTSFRDCLVELPAGRVVPLGHRRIHRTPVALVSEHGQPLLERAAAAPATIDPDGLSFPLRFTA